MSSLSVQDSIVIVGAGIIGLDVALVLAEKGYGQSITVIAEHLPGDTALTYTSPWAGCNFSAISGTDPNALKWDRLGYRHLRKLASKCSQESFVQKTPSTELWDDNVPHGKIKAMADYLDDFEIVPADQLPQGVRFAVSFTTMTINAPKHLLYLYKRLKKDYGVHFVRQSLAEINAAFLSSSTRVVFNCVGNAASTLAGVEDPKCYPTRGQVVLALAPKVQTNIMRHGRDYETYVIPRPYSNGHVILGGYMQKGVGDGSTYSYETESILTRTRDLSAEVKDSIPEVIAAFSGLRPSRQGGPRIERQNLMVGGQKRAIIHNYGAGGTGFQAGYGMALEAVGVAGELLENIKRETRSRL